MPKRGPLHSGPCADRTCSTAGACAGDSRPQRSELNSLPFQGGGIAEGQSPRASGPRLLWSRPTAWQTRIRSNGVIMTASPRTNAEGNRAGLSQSRAREGPGSDPSPDHCGCIAGRHRACTGFGLDDARPERAPFAPSGKRRIALEAAGGRRISDQGNARAQPARTIAGSVPDLAISGTDPGSRHEKAAHTSGFE